MIEKADVRYREKGDDYFSGARRDYVAALPVAPNASVLELGCGHGATGALALQQAKCGNYVGIELVKSVAIQAREVLTAVHTGDVETMGLPYGPETFDALICSEVLEHLVDPGAVLARLVRLLKPGGSVFASSPNVSHWRVVAGLLRGRFDYGEIGTMDATHLRWFTPHSFRRLFEACGVQVDSVGPLGCSPFNRRLLATLAGPLEHLVCVQIDLRGHKPFGIARQ